jgi:hypothetical protein
MVGLVVHMVLLSTDGLSLCSLSCSDLLNVSCYSHVVYYSS